MDVIEAHGLRKSYRGRAAVDGVDLRVARGEVLALLGPNGAGKTTTVEILEGHRFRDGGDVEVLGRDPGTAGREWRARLGIVLQTATDAAMLTVAEAVRHVAGFYPHPRDPAEVIERVGLTASAGKRVKALSGGQRRRVDVALGIVGSPEVVFLDEPTTGLDPQARRQFWSLVRDLAADGTTVLLTTHYLEEAEALADRVAVIVGGRVVAEGEPATLGGRAGAQAVVAWTEDGQRHEQAAHTPTALIHELAERFDGEVPDLVVRRPSLEDVYLDLTGAQA